MSESAESLISPQDEYFRTEHLQKDLKGRSVRGGLTTLSAQGVKFVLNLVSTMAMSRLLMPADFGLVAMVAPVTGFIGLFRDMGLSMATIQREEISHEQVSALFWINVVASLTLMLVVAAISPLVGWFFHDYRTTWITLALTCTFIFGGLSAQHSAILYRQMRFGVTAVIDVITLTSAVATGIIAGYLGWGYWSLLAMQAVQGLVNTVALWTVCAWRPGPFKRGVGIRSMLAFGGGVTFNTVGQYIGDKADWVMIGKVLGDVPLGLYTRANALLLTPISQITGPMFSVLTPALCRALNDPRRYERIMGAATRIILAGVTPMIVVLAIPAEAVVRVIFGPKWDGVVPVFRPLAICLLTVPLHGLYYSALRTSGNARALLGFGIFHAVIMPIVVAVGLPWGLTGVAVSYAISDVIVRTPLHLIITARGCGIRAGALVKPFWGFFGGLIPCAAAGYGAWYLVRGQVALVQLIAVGAAATAVFAVWMLASGQYKEIRGFVGSVRKE